MATGGVDEVTTCGICFHRYGYKERIPKFLRCGDTFCNVCLETMEDKGRVVCPVCKKRTKLPGGKVENLPVNRGYIRMIDMVCNACEGLAQLKLCGHCDMQVCPTCLKDHKTAADVRRQMDSMQLEQKPSTRNSISFRRSDGSLITKIRSILYITRNLNLPQAVVMYEGNLHVADCVADCRICVYSLQGEYIRSYKLPGPPFDLTVTPDGHLVVATKFQLRVVRGDQVVRTIGSEGDQPGQFKGAFGVTCSRDGLLYVADLWNHRVQVLKMTGEVVRVIDTAGDRKMNVPRSVAIEPTTGNLYVARGMSVLIYTPDGRYQTSITADNIPGITGFRPQYVSFREDGMLAVSDWTKHQVHLMRSRTHIQTLGGQGKKPGQFDSPRGTLFTDVGLVVVDQDNNRVQIFPGL